MAALICTLALSPAFIPRAAATLDRYATCYHVEEHALDAQLDPYLAAALVHEESRFVHDARSHTGARGPMQVSARFHCPRQRPRGCNFFRAGIDALQRYKARWPEPEETLCHYNAGGECTARSRRYALRILRRAELYRRLAHMWGGLPR